MCRESRPWGWNQTFEALTVKKNLWGKKGRSWRRQEELSDHNAGCDLKRGTAWEQPGGGVPWNQQWWVSIYHPSPWWQRSQMITKWHKAFKELTDFPGGAEDRHLLAKAEDTSFDPQSGKIPHATEQLSPRATTPEPTGRNYWSLHSTAREATTVRSPHPATEQSRLTQLGKVRLEQWRPPAQPRG